MSEQILELDKICMDSETQPRVAMSPDLVIEYSQKMMQGEEFPPVSVVHDGSNYWLYDGFHRCCAAKNILRGRIAAEVREGTKQDAVWLSLAANKAHGMRRKRKDRINAICRAIEMGHDKSNKDLALHLGVNSKTIGNYRARYFEAPQGPTQAAEALMGSGTRSSRAS